MKIKIDGFPMAGKSGKRDNFDNLLQALSILFAPERVAVLDIRHNKGCPFEQGKSPISACTCRFINVEITEEALFGPNGGG